MQHQQQVGRAGAGLGGNPEHEHGGTGEGDEQGAGQRAEAVERGQRLLFHGSTSLRVRNKDIKVISDEGCRSSDAVAGGPAS
ncbi:hypothetical protein G6F21_014709 [Rhizopus arrhizus]|nr:hypothetical protein G6F21_014709 [Rhizopus arrhizus]